MNSRLLQRLQIGIFCLGLLASPVCGQVKLERGAPDKPWVYHMTVEPAAEPQPALRFQLFRGDNERKPGNAALYYHRAIGLLHPGLAKEVSDLSEVVQELENQGKQLTDFPKDKVRLCIAKCQAVLEELEFAVNRESCHWGIRIQELDGPQTMSLRLGEFQESRNLARMLQLKARLEIVDRDYDAAVRTIETGMQLARDVSKCPNVIAGLIGAAISGSMSGPLMDLMAEPNSPNLYWALSTVPQPLIDFRPAVQHELNWTFKYPLIRDAEKSHTPEEWKRLFFETYHQLEQIAGTSNSDQSDTLSQAAGMKLLLQQYPRAKQELVRFGLTAEQVEQMPVIQVVALHEAKLARHKRDEILKWVNLPYHQAMPFIQRAERRHPGAPAEASDRLADLEESFPLFDRLRPALGSVFQAGMRVDRRTVRLMAIEAVRLHAVGQGKFPAALHEIKEVPVPVDPATGQPVVYRLEQETAVLEFPGDRSYGHAADVIRLTLRKAK